MYSVLPVSLPVELALQIQHGDSKAEVLFSSSQRVGSAPTLEDSKDACGWPRHGNPECKRHALPSSHALDRFGLLLVSFGGIALSFSGSGPVVVVPAAIWS